MTYEVVNVSKDTDDVVGTMTLGDAPEVDTNDSQLRKVLLQAFASTLQLRTGGSKDGVSWSGIVDVKPGDPEYPDALDEYLHEWDYILREV